MNIVFNNLEELRAYIKENPTVAFIGFTYHSAGVMASKSVLFGDRGRNIHTYYWPNGKVKYEESGIDGLVDGICREYNEDGKLVSERSYLRGKRHELSRVWDDFGNLRFHGRFENDVLVNVYPV